MPAKKLILWMLPVILFYSCSEFQQTGERVTEGVTYHLSTDLLFNPLIVQFIDPQMGKPPADVQVQVSASDFSGVYTLDGRLDLRPVKGILPLGVRKDELRGVNGPLQIQLTYSAPGYPDRSQVFLVRDTMPRLILVPMEQEESEPEADQLRTQIRLSSPVTQSFTSAQNAFSLTFPKQVNFLNEQGTVRQGVATLRGAFYRNTPDNRNFLRQQVTNQPFRLHDGRDFTINIEPLGMLTLNLEHTSTSRTLYPFTVEMVLPSSTVNRFTGRPLQAGDRIPVLGYHPLGAHWEMAGLARVVQKNGRLWARTNQTAIRPIVLGWPSFQDPGIESECILLLDMKADVPEPFSGVYRRDHLDTVQTKTGRDSVILIKEEVFFSYEQQPALGFAAIFPDCATGNAQGLEGFVREAQEQIISYFRGQDSLAFQGVRFYTERNLFPVLRPEACLDLALDPEKQSITLLIDAQSATDGFLAYQYANIQMEEYVMLKKGINAIDLPLPDAVFLLNTTAQFGFSFEERCVRFADGLQTDLCALREGFSFAISPPFQHTPVSLTLKGETACGNVHTTQTVIRPTVPVLFREYCPDAALPYRYLGQLTDGIYTGTTPLRAGTSYDFLMPIGQSYTLLENIRLEPGASFRRNTNTVFVEQTGDGSWVIDLGKIDLPDAICALAG